MPLERFHGGVQPEALRKLNAIVEALNRLLNMRGDEQFINVIQGAGGNIVTLNVAAVLARMPRLNAGGGSGFLDGSGTPSSGTGVDGDYYLDTATGKIYKKSSGSWSLIYTPPATYMPTACAASTSKTSPVDGVTINTSGQQVLVISGADIGLWKYNGASYDYLGKPDGVIVAYGGTNNGGVTWALDGSAYAVAAGAWV